MQLLPCWDSPSLPGVLNKRLEENHLNGRSRFELSQLRKPQYFYSPLLCVESHSGLELYLAAAGNAVLGLTSRREDKSKENTK